MRGSGRVINSRLFLRRTLGLPAAGLVALVLAAAAHAEEERTASLPPPLKPRVVIVAYFEIGEDTGDRAGELQLWVEREHLDRIITVPGVFNHVRANRDGSIIALKVGPLSINPAANLVALGNSPLFDLRQSYWLLQGIAGVTPAHGTIGSAAWTDFVVDGDAVREIDARELPPGWETGSYPLMGERPYPRPRVPPGTAEDTRTWREPAFHISGRHDVVRLNPVLTAWAFGLTRGLTLPDTAAMKRNRASYAGFPEAQRPAGVLLGGELSTERFWAGEKMDEWANRWMAYMTDGCSTMVTTSENDIGSLVAIESLRQAGKADPDRVLLLRTASNFDRPPPGVSLAQFMAAEQHGAYTGFDSAVEALYQVGAPVVHRLVERGGGP
jgi:purine nucleoside permease